MQMSEGFWSGFITVGTAFLLAVLGVCYKSKCRTIECCCIKIVRDTEGELAEDKIEHTKEVEMPDQFKEVEQI
jgi:hypothetical protein